MPIYTLYYVVGDGSSWHIYREQYPSLDDSDGPAIAGSTYLVATYSSEAQAQAEARSLQEVANAIAKAETLPTEGTTFTVFIGGTSPEDASAACNTLEEAIRTWNRRRRADTDGVGGIDVLVLRNGNVVRDGWIVKVDDHGTYLNPNLTLT